MQMSWPLRCFATAAFAFVASGCSEKADGPPTGPEFHTIIDESSGCDVGHLSQLANFFFKQPRQGVVKNLVDLLGTQNTQDPYGVNAKNTGFNIMAQVEAAVNDATSGDPAVGSDLINHLLLCMYNPSSEASSYPETFPESFTISLTQTSSAHGAFGERSGASVSAVLSRPLSAPYTGVAPPTSSTKWGDLITNNPHRVVYYGRPDLTDDTKLRYEWKSIPRGVNLGSSYVIVGFCLDAATQTTTMIVEQSTGGTAVQAYADAYFLTPTVTGTCSPNLAVLAGTSPFQLAHRLFHYGMDLLSPSPLMAAVLTTGVGSKTKCCSVFGPTSVGSVDLAVTPSIKGTPSIPTTLKVNTQKFPLTVTTKSGNTPVNGVRITLSTGTNNGTPTTIRKAASATADCKAAPPAVGVTGEDGNAAGTYDFPFLCITSTGGVFVTITADVADRSDQPVSLTSNKTKVIP
jgi:hypothetical protein